MSDTGSITPTSFTLGTAFAPDAVLFEAARTDVQHLRRDYILAVRAMQKASTSEEDIVAARVRLRDARAALATALNVLDFARGEAS
jgi:hypothetical protein